MDKETDSREKREKIETGKRSGVRRGGKEKQRERRRESER